MKEKKIFKATIQGGKTPIHNSNYELKRFTEALNKMKLPQPALEVIGIDNTINPRALANVRYRTSIYRHGCQRALNIKGDLLDFGVWHGIFPYLFHDRYNEKIFGKKHYLFDTWGEGWEKHNDPELIDGSDESYRYSLDIYSEVKERFKNFDHIEFVRGVLPESAAKVVDKLSSISFVSVDINSDGNDEYELIELVWDKLSEGAMLYLDDYGFAGYQGLNEKIYKLSELLDKPVFEIPVGSGYIIK